MVVLAGYLQEAGEQAKSIALLEAVVAAHPDYAEAYNSLGVAYMRAGRHDRARLSLQKVLELDPTSAKAYQNLGEDKLAAGELPAAIVDLRHAVDLDPRLFDALYNLAMALDAVGSRDEARALMERFVSEAPPARYVPTSRASARCSPQKNRGRPGSRPLSMCSVRFGRRSMAGRVRPLDQKTNRAPMRSVRGPRIAVGAWKVEPVR